MKITTIGVDLAKRVFQVYGVDERGRVVVRKTAPAERGCKVLCEPLFGMTLNFRSWPISEVREGLLLSNVTGKNGLDPPA